MAFNRKLASMIIRGRIFILVALLLFAVFAAFMIPRTVINYDLNKYLSEDTMTKRALHVMEDEFGSLESAADPGEETDSQLLDLQKRIGEEIPLVMIVCVVVVLGMLLVTSRAWLEPLVIMIVLAVSIVINMGTNFIFPDISFVTFAVCAILQLALSIDYAIMLLHAFNAYREGGMDAKEAMTEALAECFMRISSSAMTTVAGLMSLLFMSFTIGFDIGMVLSKGIIISMLGVFLLMPAVALMMEKAIYRTKHKPLSFGGDRLARGIDRARKPLAALLVLAVFGGLYLNSRTIYSFSEESTGTTPLVLLVPGGDSDEDLDKQRDLITRLQAITREDGSPALGDMYSMVTTGAEAVRYLTPDDAAEMTGLDKTLLEVYWQLNGWGETVRADKMLDASAVPSWFVPELAQARKLVDEARSALIGPHYSRVAMELNFPNADPNFNGYMDEILGALEAVYGDDYYVTGLPMSIYDISHAFRGDLLKVNLITLGAILLIVAVSFRSLRMPLLLVFVIEGAIWITMGISRLFGQPIFFISYLICLSIQMGATIDYGILLADQYRSRRAEGLAPRDALVASLKRALPTILTSGVILILAGFFVGKLCSIYYIYSIGLLVSRGALVSALLMLTLLPTLLLLCDRFVIPQKKKEQESCS